METPSEQPKSLADLLDYLRYLGNRITRLEEKLDLPPLPMVKETPERITESRFADTDDVLEFQIGEFWFAKVGVVILAIGIIFVLTLPYQDLPAYLPGTIGYVLTLGIAGSSFLLKKSYLFISRYLLGGALLLFYFSTLRLHFFAVEPALSSKTILVVLLLLVVVFNLVVSTKRKSIYLFAVNLTLGFVTAVVSDNAYFIFVTIALLSSAVVYFKLKFQWKKLVLYGLFLTYFTHFLWFINNPLLGREVSFVLQPELNLVFLLVYFIIYSMGHLLRAKNEPEDDLLIVTTLMNCIFSFGLFLLISIMAVKESLTVYHLAGSIVFLLLSYIFWIKVKSRYSSFFYAIVGFSALSVAIIAGYGKPDFFILLCWQSLLVVAVALLYRSKIIVVANFFIFLLIFLSYLVAAEIVGGISISFGLVALFSARIMNWQKHRLEIKTEMIRNAYLLTAFIIFPYALYHMVPQAYVSLSWVGLAILFYIIGVALKIKKYRWMALYTLLLSALYLLIIGIRQPDSLYRIISFVSLGGVLVLISLIYTRTKAKQRTEVKR
jgi:hypothetical protein